MLPSRINRGGRKKRQAWNLQVKVDVRQSASIHRKTWRGVRLCNTMAIRLTDSPSVDSEIVAQKVPEIAAAAMTMPGQLGAVVSA